ncbi:MAG: nickel-responsive transcriptional regulator NikR [Candidatus Aminicenantes bacterium]|nr:nickel-responsive transcriptional regulator NikR [Candidatus Aminicenantes bacterium]
MGRIVRFGVSLEAGLLAKFDALLRGRGSASRSEGFRDLIRRELVSHEWLGSGEVAGAVTLIYDHHRKDLMSRVTDIQHDYHHLILSAQHIHLDHDHCLEIIAVKGKPGDVRRLADALRAIKGVKHGTLSMSTTGRGLE